MQFELFVSDRDYNIFYSWHPKLEAVKIIVERDEQVISNIRQRIKEAKEEIELINKTIKIKQ